MEILTKYALEIFFGLVSAGALAFCKHLYSKNKKLEEMQKADQNRQYRQMILDEIEPIVDELSRLKSEIAGVDNNAKAMVNQLKADADATHNAMYKDLQKVEDENIGKRKTFADIAETVAKHLGIEGFGVGEAF
jgi:predicted phage-related endonuclease